MIEQIVKSAQNIGLPGHKIEDLKSILNHYQDRDEHLKRIIDILEAEASSSYLEKNHFNQTYKFKQLFDFSFSEDVSKILAMIYPQQTFEGSSAFFGNIDQKDAVDSAVDQIEKEGFWIVPEKLKADIVDNIIHRLADVRFFMRGRLKRLSGYHASRAEQIPSNTAWVSDQQDILTIPEVQDLSMDPFILNIVANYFGSTPIHVQTNCWWSTNFEKTKHALSANAQLFHQDKEFIKFLKVFIYLNDVNEENGAHVYVRGSHRDNKFQSDPGYKISSRINDSDILDKYGKDNVLSMIGEKGTVILEDTSGFHKGMPVQRGHRLLLQIEYTNCLYFNPVNAFSKNELGEKYIDFLEDHPRFSLNYDDAKYLTDVKAERSERLKRNIKGLIKSKLSRFLKK